MVTQNTLGQNNDEHKTGALEENLRKVSSIDHPMPGSKIATDDQMTTGIKEIRGEIEKNIKENEKKRVARYQLPQCRYQLPQCEGNEKKVEYFSNIVNYAAMILESVEGKSDSQKLGKWTKDLQSDFLKLKTAFEKSSDQQNSLDILRKNKKLTQSLQGTIREIVDDLAKHNKHEDKSILDIFMEKNTYLNSDEMKKHVDLDKHEFRQLKNHVESFSSLDPANLINCQDIYKALSQDLPCCYQLKGGKNATPHSKEIPHRPAKMTHSQSAKSSLREVNKRSNDNLESVENTPGRAISTVNPKYLIEKKDETNSSNFIEGKAVESTPETLKAIEEKDLQTPTKKVQYRNYTSTVNPKYTIEKKDETNSSNTIEEAVESTPETLKAIEEKDLQPLTKNVQYRNHPNLFDIWNFSTSSWIKNSFINTIYRFFKNK